MVVDGALGEHEPLCDRAIRQPFGDQRENLELSSGQSGGILARQRRGPRIPRPRRTTSAARRAPRSSSAATSPSATALSYGPIGSANRSPGSARPSSHSNSASAEATGAMRRDSPVGSASPQASSSRGRASGSPRRARIEREDDEREDARRRRRPWRADDDRCRVRRAIPSCTAAARAGRSTASSLKAGR